MSTAKIPYSGGWRAAYAERAKSLGFEVQPSGRYLLVFHGGKAIGEILITREMDLDVDLPKELANYHAREAEKTKVAQAALESENARRASIGLPLTNQTQMRRRSIREAHALIAMSCALGGWR